VGAGRRLGMWSWRGIFNAKTQRRQAAKCGKISLRLGGLAL